MQFLLKRVDWGSGVFFSIFSIDHVSLPTPSFLLSANNHSPILTPPLHIWSDLFRCLLILCIAYFKDSACCCFGCMVSKKKYIYAIDDGCFEHRSDSCTTLFSKMIVHH